MTSIAANVSPPEVARRLAPWFAEAARELPWRRDRTPYRALVAEAMLQQTQVARVIERYEAFLLRFPDVQTLAAADEQEVLALWQGLGYYRRARHLHAAARAIVDRFDGDTPMSLSALRTLPGVGRYTAGAVASLAGGVRAPIVDGNVHRVLARLQACPTPASDPARLDAVWAWATRYVEDANAAPGVVNEALMELGAIVCTPRNPRCDVCPVRELCRAHAIGSPGSFPAPKPRAARLTVHHHAVVVSRGARLLLEQRPAAGLWSRMWQTPTVESTRRLAPSVVKARLAVPVTKLVRRETFEHLTTHRRVVFHVFTGSTRVRRGAWHGRGELDGLPMSNAHRRVLALTEVVR